MGHEVFLEEGYLSEKAILDAFLDLDNLDPGHNIFLEDKERIAVILGNLKNAVFTKLYDDPSLMYYFLRHELNYDEDDKCLTVLGHREEVNKIRYYTAVFTEEEYWACVERVQQEVDEQPTIILSEPDEPESDTNPE